MRTKVCVRFYTITDYEAEEQWLHDMYMQGWRPRRFVVPCFYTFEEVAPKDMVFKLEFNDAPMSSQPEYLSLLRDYGWEYLFSCMGWRYYCKSKEADADDNELFTDNASKLEMVENILKRRFIPITVVFLCCVLPNAHKVLSGSQFSWGWMAFWLAMLLFYVYLLVHCGLGLRRLKNKYNYADADEG